MSQQSSITKFISTTTVDTNKPPTSTPTTERHIEKSNENVFHNKSTPKAAKRLHSCLSSDSDHSICIENELDSIKLSIDKIIKKR